MTTENDDWKPRNRYNDDEGNFENGQNRERRPYQSYNRGNYGNSQGGNYNNRQGGGNYDQQRTNYNRNYGNNYERREGGGEYNNFRQHSQRDNQQRSYGNQDRSYGNQDRSQGRPYNQDRSYGNQNRPYGNQNRSSYGNQDRSYGDQESGGLIKKRRPRVSESSGPDKNTNYNSYPSSSYSRNSGGGYQQRGGRPNQAGGGNRYPNPNRSSQNYDPNAKYSLKKQMKYREENFDPNEPIRLNKYLANAGVCSRREADEFIKAGVVKVNEEVISELGTKVKRSDEVKFHDQPIKLEQKVYVLLNKPKNCVTTADDPQERLTVMDLVKNACMERIFPVGRLDRNTTGVLLLTNDGDLASKLTHPKFLKKKIYHVWLDKDVSVDDMQKLAEGVELEDGEIHADAISYVTETDKDQVGVEIHSGRNHIVRRMFEAVGYHVTKLDRVYFAGLTKKNLKRGQWRYLNDKEVSMLRMGAFE